MAGSLAPLAAGLYPVMLTPFTPDGSSVDYPVLEALTRWYLDNGAAGLFPVAQSSEMYNLQAEERIACAKVVKAAAQGWHAACGGAGRAPVVCAAGTFEGSVEEKAAFARRMHEEGGADVVVVLVCMMAAQEEDDAAWKANAEQFMALTGDVPLGLYECPAPYHRLLTPATLRWLADSGRFRFHKDTSRRNDLISEKLAALEGHGGPFRWYNGNCTTLLHSLQAGGDGFGGVTANYYPHLAAWLCKHWEDQPAAAAKLQRFLTVAEGIVKQMYPASAKTYVAQCNPGFPLSGYCRNGSTFNDHPENVEKLECLRAMEADMCAELGITVVPPSLDAASDAGKAAAAAATSLFAASSAGDGAAVPNALEFD